MTSIGAGIATAVATEVAADTAIIGGIMAARGKAPWAFVGAAAGLAVAGMVALIRMVPAIEAQLIEAAGEPCACEEGEGCACHAA